MSVDHDALMRRAQQLIATKTTNVHTKDALLRQLEKCLVDTHRRIGRSRDLLAESGALLQQSKLSGYGLPDKPMLQNQDSN